MRLQNPNNKEIILKHFRKTKSVPVRKQIRLTLNLSVSRVAKRKQYHHNFKSHSEPQVLSYSNSNWKKRTREIFGSTEKLFLKEYLNVAINVFHLIHVERIIYLAVREYTFFLSSMAYLKKLAVY